MEVSIFGLDKLKAKSEQYLRAKAFVRAGIGKAAQDFANDAVSIIKKDYLSGPRPERLGTVTGRLRSSIMYFIQEDSDSLLLRFGTDVPYAPIHEFGGLAGKGHHVLIRKRPFLSTGVADALPAFQKDIEDILVKAVAGE